MQAAHAAIEACRTGLIPPNGSGDGGLAPGGEAPHPHLVLCHVNSIPALLRAAESLRAAGIRFQIFHEPDLGGAPTALATEPLRGEARAPLRRFPLLKEHR